MLYDPPFDPGIQVDPYPVYAELRAHDPRRPLPRTLSFSSGPHFCVGNHLARLQATVAFEELLAAIPDLSTDVEQGRRHRSAFPRGWESLPLVTSSG